MQYNDTTNNLGIIQACEDYCGLGNTGISGDTNKLKEFTRYANKVSRRIWHWIFLAQGLWKYDDSNETDLPQAVTDLTSGTAKYALPTEALTIERIEIKSNEDDWFRIEQLPTQYINGAVDEFFEDDGEVVYYRLIGNTIELFPAPDYSKTGGIKVYFDRTSVDFATTDTTKTPGFASPYHDAVPIGASLEWLKSKRPDSNVIVHLTQEWLRYEQDIKKFYQLRNKDHTPFLSRSYENYS